MNSTDIVSKDDGWQGFVSLASANKYSKQTVTAGLGKANIPNINCPAGQ